MTERTIECVCVRERLSNTSPNARRIIERVERWNERSPPKKQSERERIKETKEKKNVKTKKKIIPEMNKIKIKAAGLSVRRSFRF